MYLNARSCAIFFPYLYVIKRKDIMETLKDLKDEELVALLNRGSEAALAEIYARYWGRLYVHALKMLQEEPLAQDAVQETFIRLWHNRAQLAPGGSLDAYLYRAVPRRVLNGLRDRQVRSQYTGLFAQYIDRHRNQTLEGLHEKELLATIDGIVRKLPARMREIFELSRYEDLNHAEIAARLGIAPATVKRQVSNAIKILKDELGKQDGLILLLLGTALLAHHRHEVFRAPRVPYDIARPIAPPGHGSANA